MCLCRAANPERDTNIPGQAFACCACFVRGSSSPCPLPLAQTRPVVQGRAKPPKIRTGGAGDRFRGRAVCPRLCRVPKAGKGERREGLEGPGGRTCGTAPPPPPLGPRRPPSAHPSGERVSLRRGRPWSGLAPGNPRMETVMAAGRGSPAVAIPEVTPREAPGGERGGPARCGRDSPAGLAAERSGQGARAAAAGRVGAPRCG